MWRRIIYHPEVNYALRQTLVLCLPVALGWLFGDLQKGLLFSLVPACCNIAGLDTPHKRFFKRLIIGGSLFAFGSLLMQWLLLKDVPLPLILFAMPLLLGVTGEISPLHARLLPGTLIAAIFTISLIGRMPIYVPPLLYIGGTLWYGLFNWFWFWLWKEQPMRESLSLIYRELANYCDAKYSLLTQLTDPEKALPPLLVRQQKAVDLINTCYQQMHMLSASRDHSHKRLTRAFQVALDLQEHISVSLHQPEEVQKLVEQSHAEAVIRWNARTISARLRELADDILYHQLSSRFDMDKQLGALEKIARQHPDNPVGNFCLYHFSRIARVLRTQKPLYQRDLMADRQRRLPLLPALRSYLSLRFFRAAHRRSFCRHADAGQRPGGVFLHSKALLDFDDNHVCQPEQLQCNPGSYPAPGPGHLCRVGHCGSLAAPGCARTAGVEYHAGHYLYQLSLYPTVLRLVDGRIYGHGRLYAATALP